MKSFPIVTDDEDVAAAMDQTKKAAKKASKKAAAVMVSEGCGPVECFQPAVAFVYGCFQALFVI